MGFFECLKKGFEMAMLKGEAAEEVAADEGAFIPAMVIFAFPMLILEAILLLLFSIGMAFLPIHSITTTVLAFLFAFNILVVLGPFIAVGILHLIAKLFGGEGEYYGYYQAMGAGSVISWFGIIPYIGILFSLWSIVVNIIITRHVQRISTGRAAAVVLLPIFVAFVLVIFLFVFVGMGMFMGMMGKGAYMMNH